jgi:hypothetical protein
VNDKQWTTLTINNAIPSGAAFGYDQTTGVSCFIPASVMFNTGAQIGETVEALLIDNPNLAARARTPYMVQYLQPTSRQAAPTVTPRAAPNVAPSNQTVNLPAFVRDRMRNGGVWTVNSLLDEYREDPTSILIGIEHETSIVSATLHTMFANSECAKWVLYTNGSQIMAREEWFSCYPEKVDVDEWE